MSRRRLTPRLVVLLATQLTAASVLIPAIDGTAQTVTVDWLGVGDPYDAADTKVMIDETIGYGSVPYSYRISKCEVTNPYQIGLLWK